MSNIQLTQELVKSLFDYHEDGYLIWKIRPSPTANKGDKAGYLHTPKNLPHRRLTKIKGKLCLSSRIIFLYHKGYLPVMVDHRDRDTTNDRIENLRESDHAKNSQNRTSRKGSTSKYLGVHLCLGKYWVAQISANKKTINLGSYKTETEAALAYNKAALMAYGEHANLNTF